MRGKKVESAEMESAHRGLLSSRDEEGGGDKIKTETAGKKLIQNQKKKKHLNKKGKKKKSHSSSPLHLLLWLHLFIYLLGSLSPLSQPVQAVTGVQPVVGVVVLTHFLPQKKKNNHSSLG